MRNAKQFILKLNNKSYPVDWKASKDFYEWLSKHVHSNILTLPQSELFVQASAYNVSIVEYSPKSKAAIAVLELCNKIREYINIPLE